MKTLHSIATLGLIIGAVSFATAGCKTHEHMHGSDMSTSSGSYPLSKCVVSDEPLGDKPYVFTHDGKEVRLCCKDCLANFNKNPEKYMAKLQSAK